MELFIPGRADARENVRDDGPAKNQRNTFARVTRPMAIRT
jgi:hypothetical protein